MQPNQKQWTVWISPTFDDPSDCWRGILEELAKRNSNLLQPKSDICELDERLVQLWPHSRRINEIPRGGAIACFIGREPPAEIGVPKDRLSLAFLPSDLSQAGALFPAAAKFDKIISLHLPEELKTVVPPESLRSVSERLCFFPPTLGSSKNETPQKRALRGILTNVSPDTKLGFAISLVSEIEKCPPMMLHQNQMTAAKFKSGFKAAKNWLFVLKKPDAPLMDLALAAASEADCSATTIVDGSGLLHRRFSTASRMLTWDHNSDRFRDLAGRLLSLDRSPAQKGFRVALQGVYQTNGTALRWDALIERKAKRPNGDDAGFWFPFDFLTPSQTNRSDGVLLAERYLVLFQTWFDVAHPGGAAHKHLQLLRNILAQERNDPRAVVLLAEIDELIGVPLESLFAQVDTILDETVTGASASLARVLGRTGRLHDIPRWRERLPKSEQIEFATIATHSFALSLAHLYRREHTESDLSLLKGAAKKLWDENRRGSITPRTMDLLLQLLLVTDGPDASCSLLATSDPIGTLTPTVHAAHLAWFGHDEHANRILEKDTVFQAQDSLQFWLRGMVCAILEKPAEAVALWNQASAIDPNMFDDATPCDPDFWMWQAFALERLGESDLAAKFSSAAERRDLLYTAKLQRLKRLTENRKNIKQMPQAPDFGCASNPPAYNFNLWKLRKPLRCP